MGQGVIDLNGKRYDAHTGAYLGKSDAKSAPALQGRVIDGFIRPAHAAGKKKPTPMPVAPIAPKPIEALGSKPVAAKPAAPVAPKVVKEVVAKKPTEHTPEPTERAERRAHAMVRPMTAHRPEHSKTLMRRSVHKPETHLKPAIKVQTPSEVAVKTESGLMRKHSGYQVEPARQERAARAQRHGSVHHFKPAHGVSPEPQQKLVASVPVIPVRQAPQHVAARAAAPVHRARPDIFEEAIAKANSHAEPKQIPRAHRNRRRLVNSLAITAVFLVIAGFIGYLNVPNIELRVASMQAGFHASMPGYTPTGYALKGGVDHSGGTVSLSFRSGASNYTITQQASDWNSQTLLDNTLALSGSHQTVEKDGQTIYIYNGANAAWVNGGVRYDLTGNADLTPDDITAIATSL